MNSRFRPTFRPSLLAVACLLATSLFVARAAAAPLTLDEAIQLALRHNQRMKVSAFGRDIGRANVLAAYGAFDPALTFRRSYGESESLVNTSPLVTAVTRTDDYSLTLGGLTPWGMSYGLSATANLERGTANRFTDNYVTFGGVSVTQPLLRGFGFGANLAALRVAKADRGISDWQHRQTVIDTVTNVILVYNNLAQARENVRIAHRSRDLASQLVEQNEARKRIGAIADADVLQPRARVARLEESILLAERAARDLDNQLRQLIGESHYTADSASATLELEPLPPAEPFTVDAAADLKHALVARPDYQAARLGVAIRRANDARARNDLLPRVDVVGSYGYSGVDRDFAASRRQVRNEDVRDYSIGLVVSVPLTFAEGRGRARAARLSLRQSEADLVRLEQDIALDVAAAAGQIETTRRRAAATATALELAKQALTAEEKRFKAGTGRTLDVLSAQDNLSQAENSYASALAAERRAVASYEREIGITLTRRRIATE